MLLTICDIINAWVIIFAVQQEFSEGYRISNSKQVGRKKSCFGCSVSEKYFEFEEGGTVVLCMVIFSIYRWDLIVLICRS